MTSFPISTLKARHAFLSGVPGDAGIQILLSPFLWEGELIDTSIRLDGVELPSVMLRSLVARSFDFPVNPEDGYIDGSIYLAGMHQIVDVTRLEFHRSRHDGVTLVVRGVYRFDERSLPGSRETPFTLNAMVSSCALDDAA
ncbi:hypothetical protein H9K76_18600 [Diaphorobacter ruginosibacter]|uniref:Uncharacterized protein n=1 Tax=Diaphorobacter ruginosibacter TaxID=1715720 RepID=A0A7G9RLP9_9BURK|nr:hypothetical protein [Diaphorobacter ruginosibacter]QNN56524.1 hypothetical protein H9K76_18600 [Diaphorobacter ruginosibacter]